MFVLNGSLNDYVVPLPVDIAIFVVAATCFIQSTGQIWRVLTMGDSSLTKQVKIRILLPSTYYGYSAQ